jgi:uncharacterized protein (DUF2267 family)
MQHDEFIGLVQNRAHLSSRGDAERACRATLETLGERMPEGLADNLAAQLPHEIGEHLRRTEVYGGQGTGERFGKKNFIGRVAARADVSEQQAAFFVRAVMEVTGEATQGGLPGKLDQSLPTDIREPVTAGASG